MSKETLEEVLEKGGNLDPFGEKEKEIYQTDTTTYIIIVQGQNDSAVKNPKVELRVIEEKKGGVEPLQRNHHAGDWANLNAITSVLLQKIVSNLQVHGADMIRNVQDITAENIELKKKLGIEQGPPNSPNEPHNTTHVGDNEEERIIKK